jgi:hypothetical protein
MRWNTARPLSATHSSQIQTGDTTKIKESFNALFSRRVVMSPSEFQRRFRSTSLPERQLPVRLVPGCLTLMGEISEKEQFSRRPRCTRFIASEALKIKLSSIMVENQAIALAFYTGVLGFKKSKDIPVGEFRWLIVVSPDGHPDVELVLERTRILRQKLFRKRCSSKESLSQRLRRTISKPRQIG